MTAPSTQRTQDMAARLAATWPRLFAPEFSRAWRPLAVGIRESIEHALHLDNDSDRKALSRALATHCRSTQYLRALSAGRPRAHLDGKHAGHVSQPERDKATAEVKARKAARHAARALGKPAPAPRPAPTARPTVKVKKHRTPQPPKDRA